MIKEDIVTQVHALLALSDSEFEAELRAAHPEISDNPLEVLDINTIPTLYKTTVIKDPSGLYEYAEFLVVGFNLDKNLHVVYQCDAGEGLPFLVKRKGTAAIRLADARAAESNIGKWLTVEFETWSKPRLHYKRGLPLKPVGLDFRNCDLTGQPIE
jgi:hypothetical protein